MNNVLDKAKIVIHQSANFVQAKSMRGLLTDAPYVLMTVDEDGSEAQGYFVLNHAGNRLGSKVRIGVDESWICMPDEVDLSSLCQSTDGNWYLWADSPPWISVTDMNRYIGTITNVFKVDPFLRQRARPPVYKGVG